MQSTALLRVNHSQVNTHITTHTDGADGAVPSREKYLLCRPEGGLNDVLNQVAVCFQYCLKYDRVLVIDTINTKTFREPFTDYFMLDHPALKWLPDPSPFLAAAAEQRLSLFPPCARLVHGDEQPHYASGNYVVLNQRITFDFTQAYPHDILVHHQCGRAPQVPREFLQTLRLRPALCEAVKTRWRSLPKPYASVHLRNTDMKCAMESLLPAIRRLRGNVFLATDSAKTQRLVQELLPGRLHITEIPDFDDRALHLERVFGQAKTNINTGAIIDVILLALARNLHLGTARSGYAILARQLNRDQPLLRSWFKQEWVGRTFLWQLRLNSLDLLACRILRRLRRRSR